MYKRRTSSRTAATRSTKAPVGKIKAPPQTRRARPTTKRGQTRRSRSRSQSRSPEMLVAPAAEDISPKSVKSQTNMDISTAVAASQPIPYIIFHENEIGASSESDSYRPIIVINRPLFSNSGKNTAYYRSSGRSNEQLNRVYSNTWFPIAGLIERGGYVNANGKTIPYGFILKVNAILSEILTIGEKKSYKWIYDTLIDYFNNTVPENYKTHINLIRLDNKPYDPTNASYFREIKNDLMDINKHDDQSVDYFEKIIEEYNELYKFLNLYFLNLEQLYISAYLGGGYWDKKREFRDYVLNNYATSQFTSLAEEAKHTIYTINVPTKSEPGENTQEVIDFLNANNAQYSINEIIENNPPSSQLVTHNYYIASSLKSILSEVKRVRVFIKKIPPKPIKTVKKRK